jgi:hypothetical protein
MDAFEQLFSNSTQRANAVLGCCSPVCLNRRRLSGLGFCSRLLFTDLCRDALQQLRASAGCSLACMKQCVESLQHLLR